MLNLGKDFPALRIINVFSGEMAAPAIKMLRMNSISNVRVTANMTNLFWPLDLTVNGSAKACIKRRLTESYSPSVSQQLDEGKVFDNIKVELKLSIFKLLHSGWIKDYYLTSEEGWEGYLKWLRSSFHYWCHWKRLKITCPSQSFLWGWSFDQWSELNVLGDTGLSGWY